MERTKQVLKAFCKYFGVPKEAARIQIQAYERNPNHIFARITLEIPKKSTVYFSYEDWGDDLHAPKWRVQSSWTNNPHPTQPGETNLHDVEILTISKTGKVSIPMIFKQAIIRHMELYHEISG